MAKRRKYGDAWKDVQIDAEQNDAVFDRFFRRTPAPATPEPPAETPAPTLSLPVEHTQAQAEARPESRAGSRTRSQATVKKIAPPLTPTGDALDVADLVESLRQQYRLSKGEAAILKNLLQQAREGEQSECYAKVPTLAEACGMTHRGCQFALKNLQTRGLIQRVREYDPADRLGIKFKITLLPA